MPRAINIFVTILYVVSCTTAWEDLKADSQKSILTLNSSEGGDISIPGEGSFDYDTGTVVVITAVPDPGCHFTGWTGSAVAAGQVTSEHSVRTQVNLDADYTLQANFGRGIVYVDDNAAFDPEPGDTATGDPLEDGSPAHPFDSLQEALDLALNGDTVMVLPGIYSGPGNRDLKFNGKSITVRSTDPNDARIVDTTVIDCQGVHRAFSFLNGEGRAATVEGFTIQDGHAEWGGAILCIEASPTIKDCIIAVCTSDTYGGAIYCEESEGTIRHCRIIQNKARKRGGGIYLGTNCSVQILDSLLLSNNAGDSGGAIACELNFFGNSVIQGCSVEGNSAAKNGGGIYCRDFHGLSVTGCDIRRNQCRDQGGGLFIWQSQDSTVVSDIAVVENAADEASGMYCTLEGSAATVTLAGAVQLEACNWMVEGSGLVRVTPNTAIILDQAIARIRCGLHGPGVLEVGGNSELNLEEAAWFDLSDNQEPYQTGRILCKGLLRLTGHAQLENASVHVTRASFEDRAIVRNCVVSAEAGAPYGQFYVEEGARIDLPEIKAEGDRYLDLDPQGFEISDIQVGRIEITVQEGAGGTYGGLFECRGQDGLIGSPCPSDEFACQALEEVPAFDLTSWTIDRLELVEGAKLNLTNRFDFQYPYDADGDYEVLYVKDLVLRPHAVLNTAYHRLYYENLEGDPNQIVNVPLLGFSLNNISFNDEDDFLTRVKHNGFSYIDDVGRKRATIERLEGIEPDANGLMQMTNCIDNDPNSPRYGQLVHARAKGLFAKSNEESITIRFEYLFDTMDPNAELVIYLSDTPELIAASERDSSDHYLDVARLSAPPLDCPGATGSQRLGVFEQTVARGHLDFAKGTRIELELRGADQTGITINNWDPAVYCIYCGDVTGDAAVNSDDFLTIIAEYGSTAGITPEGNSRACLDGVFSSDGTVDKDDLSSWDWHIKHRDRVGNLCEKPTLARAQSHPMTTMSISNKYTMHAQTCSHDTCGCTLDSITTVLSKPLLISGKRGTYSDENKLGDRIYLLEANGEYADWLEPVSARGCTVLLKDVNQVYQLNTDMGIVRLSDGNVLLEPSVYSVAWEPRYGLPAVVAVGLQQDNGIWSGRPIRDAVFDEEGFLYVLPVVVDPTGEKPYTAAAKILLSVNEASGCVVERLFVPPKAPKDNRDYNYLREIDLDGNGNLYVVNAYHLNESDMLWIFDTQSGNVKHQANLCGPSSPVPVPAPTALRVSRCHPWLYLASARNDPDAHSDQLVVMRTDTLEVDHIIQIENMGHIMDITEDPSTGTVWLVGFSLDATPEYFNNESPFYRPYLAEVPAGSRNSVQGVCIPSDETNDLALPMSIIWAGH